MIEVQLFHNIYDKEKPLKKEPDDIGYDLYITELKEINQAGVYMFYTGLCMTAPYGYYWEIIPRSSIVKTGFMLANGVGVIDPSFRGQWMIPLVKINSGMSNLKTPMRIAQAVLRPICKIEFEETEFQVVEKLSETKRGEGGFGSTGIH